MKDPLLIQSSEYDPLLLLRISDDITALKAYLKDTNARIDSIQIEIEESRKDRPEIPIPVFVNEPELSENKSEEPQSLNASTDNIPQVLEIQLNSLRDEIEELKKKQSDDSNTIILQNERILFLETLPSLLRTIDSMPFQSNLNYSSIKDCFESRINYEMSNFDSKIDDLYNSQNDIKVFVTSLFKSKDTKNSLSFNKKTLKNRINQLANMNLYDFCSRFIQNKHQFEIVEILMSLDEEWVFVCKFYLGIVK